MRRPVTRRDALKLLAAAGVTSTGACRKKDTAMTTPSNANDVLATTPLGFQWPTSDPFLFCVHHDDRYPAGNDKMGPDPRLLAGRNIGMDFEAKDGWRMYHGDDVPGFPAHPHRGFETVTLVRRGLLDHSDSLGAAARYGRGDVQWLTAGRGILHAEMFPLIKADAENPVELFQIWLNLPRDAKMVDPRFLMLWNDGIPRRVVRDAEGRATDVTVVAGTLADTRPLAPPPDSWAARATSDVAIWTIRMDARARFELPPAAPGTNRSLYFFRGSALSIGGRPIPSYHRIQVRPEAALALEAGPDEVEILVLQGRPIAEPVVQYGPFVMNTRDEIRQAFLDYERTRFGGWPWNADDPVHPRADGRFAKHADGRTEKPV